MLHVKKAKRSKRKIKEHNKLSSNLNLNMSLDKLMSMMQLQLLILQLEEKTLVTVLISEILGLIQSTEVFINEEILVH